MKHGFVSEIHIIYDPINKTYNVGGGSSTQAKPRVFESITKAEMYRNKYWPKTIILTYGFIND